MTRYTPEELRRINAMRNQERADEDRRRSMWHAAGVGHSESGMEYIIEYRRDGNHTWYSADPFYEPLRLRTEETHDQEEALTVAAAILDGRWGVTRNHEPGKIKITGVRVIERVSSAKIIKLFT